MITNQEFLDWYDGQEGFGLRSERAIEELEPSNMLKLREWMFAAFEAGRASRNAGLLSQLNTGLAGTESAGGCIVGAARVQKT